MISRFLCVLTLLLGLSFLRAEGAVTVKGRIASATDDTPLAGASVRLLLLPDSTLLIGNYSDKDGLFQLTSSRLRYKSHKEQVKILLVASYMGFKTEQKSLILKPKTNEYDLKDVYLQEETRLLGETVVAATAPPIVVREDTIEYFADSYKTQPDATVEDLMKRLPGVEVNADGTIMAQGEQVQRVYVDGKEFFGNNTQMTTKNLTADMIETVQVVDMKSEEARLTGIDDGERHKVINLKLKPKMRRGWFGNAAGALGDGKDIPMRWDGRAMIGFFRGNSQNALMVNGNNTNNAGFGDLGDGVMQGSGMRGNRQSGRRGDGLNTSWSVGLNLGYDEGNRMRDANSPLAINGNLMYGGSNQEERSRSHSVNYLSKGNTITDNENRGDNQSRNVQIGGRYEKSWGNVNESGLHRLQVNPSLNYNSTATQDYTESRNGYEDPNNADYVDIHNYLSQTQRRNEMEQQGISYSINTTYSFTKRTDKGRRRSSITLNFSGRQNEGDQYTLAYTTYDKDRQEFHLWDQLDQLILNPGDTLINQWQEEDSHSESYRVRLTHVEPIAERQTLELSASANLSNRNSTQIYHFRQGEEWVDQIGDKTSRNYSSDTHTRNVDYTLSAQYRKTSETTNFSVGMDLLPQSQEYVDYFDHTRDYKRHYWNYAPRLEYRYNWTRRKFLRFTLNGSTTQPSMNQLQARKNQTSATHVSLGNKDLDPSMNGRMGLQYRTFNEENYHSYEANINASANWNTLATKRWYSDNLRTDTTMTVNLKGIGNWSVNGNFRGSIPFYDNLWYVTTNTSFSYHETQGYASIKSTDAQLNHTKTISGSEQAGIAYRGEKFNIEVRGNWTISDSKASIVTSNSLGTTHRFGVSGHVTARLPWQFTLTSDFNYIARRGFSAGMTRNQSIWDAQLSRSFLKKQNLSAFIKIFDILQQKSNIQRTVTATHMVDRETTILGQYFLVGASLKLNRMGGSRRGGDGGNRGGSEGGFRGGEGGYRGGGGNRGGGEGFGQ